MLKVRILYQNIFPIIFLSRSHFISEDVKETQICSSFALSFQSATIIVLYIIYCAINAKYLAKQVVSISTDVEFRFAIFVNCPNFIECEKLSIYGKQKCSLEIVGKNIVAVIPIK